MLRFLSHLWISEPCSHGKHFPSRDYFFSLSPRREDSWNEDWVKAKLTQENITGQASHVKEERSRKLSLLEHRDVEEVTTAETKLMNARPRAQWIIREPWPDPDKTLPVSVYLFFSVLISSLFFSRGKHLKTSTKESATWFMNFTYVVCSPGSRFFFFAL